MPPKKDVDSSSTDGRIGIHPIARYFALIGALALFIGIAYNVSLPQRGSVLARELGYFFSPSADKAYALAQLRFNAPDAVVYDLKKAEFFFKEVLKQDASAPYVRHELARIEFLRGNMQAARRLIDEEIALTGEPSSQSSYYIRGLIKGFMGEYESAAVDYEKYLRTDPNNWAAITDYAWVLLKSDRPREALVALDWGLMTWPDNPWLLNSKATAHFELGQLDLAYETALRAQQAVAVVTEGVWLQAYPGNDPMIAAQGVDAFKKAVADNIHTITVAYETRKESVQ